MILRSGIAVITVLVGLASTGCSTHRADLEQLAGPAPIVSRATPERMEQDTERIMAAAATRLATLRPNALAPLVTAAVLLHRATRTARSRVMIARFADALLAFEIRRAKTRGFASSRNSRHFSIADTTESVLALAQAFAETRDQRYRQAVMRVAPSIVSPRLGWHSSGIVGVSAKPGAQPIEIALTARAWNLLNRLPPLGIDTATEGNQARQTVLEHQAAVGRWYAQVNGVTPMNSDEWATTISALQSDVTPVTTGVLGAAVPALYANVFDAAGRLRPNWQVGSDAAGVGQTLRVVASYADQSFADRGFDTAVGWVRPNGTVAIAGADEASSAHFALAFAQRLVVQRIRE